MAVGGFLSTLKPIGESIIDIGIWAILIIVGLAVLIGIGIWAWKRKRWNLRVEVKQPRSDGRLIKSEKAKGHYDTNNSLNKIKRKGAGTVSCKPFDVRKFLQGDNYLEVVQIGPKEFVPILPKSYTVMESNPDGEKKAIMDIEADLGKRRTWKNYAERTGKARFTLSSWAKENWPFIQTGILMFIIFLGFAVIWMYMPGGG